MSNSSKSITRRAALAGAAAAPLALGTTAASGSNIVPEKKRIVEPAPLIPRPELPPTDLMVKWVEDSGCDTHERGDMVVVQREPGFFHNGNYLSRGGYVVFARMGKDGLQLRHRDHVIDGFHPDNLSVFGFQFIHDTYVAEDGRWVLAEPWIKVPRPAS